MSTNNSEPFTYQIKKNNYSRYFIIIIAIFIALITLCIFIMHKPSPKSTVKSFINSMKNNNYDKILTCIDFDGLIAFNTLNGNINNFNTALEHLNNLSDSEKEINTETISYTKRYIKAVLDEISQRNITLNINNIEVFPVENNNNLNKVVAKLSIKQNNNIKDETITFFTIKKGDKYYIIDFDGEIYF